MKILLKFWLFIYHFLLWYPGYHIVYTKGPPMILVKIIAKLILFFYPNKSKWNKKCIPKNNNKILYVVNHVTFAIDLPVLFATIVCKAGHLPRGLGDRMHFFFPITSQILKFLGCFEGNVENTTKLMEDGQPILVFPGGGREAFRRTYDPKYSLLWGERKGFARLAIQHGYTIVCVGSVGVEEQLGILYDIPIGYILYLFNDKRANEGFTLPLVYPRSLFPQTFYIYFGRENIETKRYNKDIKDENLTIVRDKAKKLLLDAIDEAREQQKNDSKKLKNHKKSK